MAACGGRTASSPAPTGSAHAAATRTGSSAPARHRRRGANSSTFAKPTSTGARAHKRTSGGRIRQNLHLRGPADRRNSRRPPPRSCASLRHGGTLCHSASRNRRLASHRAAELNVNRLASASESAAKKSAMPQERVRADLSPHDHARRSRFRAARKRNRGRIGACAPRHHRRCLPGEHRRAIWSDVRPRDRCDCPQRARS